MKVFCKGKELFEIDFTEPIPDTIEIDESTDWGNKWALFAIMGIFSGNAKFNEEYLKELQKQSRTLESEKGQQQ